MSRKRYACWRCGTSMKKKARFCRTCKRTRPQSVKAQTAFLAKSFGAQPKPVLMPVVKAAKPRCPNPACRAKGSRKANACARCGTPFTPVHAARAEKARRSAQLSIVHSADWWQAQAKRQHDPAEREACLAEAQRAHKAAGTESSSLAALLVRASRAGSIREAWLREADPHAREVLRQALYDNGRGRPA